MSLPKGVALRGPVYHLQIKVPLRLRQYFPGPFWIRASLGTGDKSAAAVIAHRHWAEASEAFARAEAKMKPAVAVALTPAVAAYVIRQAARAPLVHDEVTRFTAGGALQILQDFAQPVRYFQDLAAPQVAELPAYLQESPDGSITPAQLDKLRELHSAIVDNHAAALSLADVIQRDGIWLLDINEDAEGKSVKSAAGVREVAVHPKLVELGFIDYLRHTRGTGHSLLFPFGRVVPSRTASVNYSDFFRQQCQALGLYRRFRDFHAFRTTVGTTLRASEPPLGEALITAVMGHEAGNVGAANYHRPAAQTLARAVARLDFPAVLALPRAYPATPTA